MAKKDVKSNYPIIMLVVLLFISLPQIVVAQTSNKGVEVSVQQLAQDIAGQMTQRNISKIAIGDFTDLNGRKSALGDFISEELVTNFYTAGTGSFDVVERRELARILEEQNLQQTGLLDNKTIAEIGKLLGVDAIVIGSIAYLGESVKINARIIGVENAKVFAAAAQKVVMDPMIENLLNQSARAATVTGSSSSGVQIQRFDAIFQNKFLRVEPKAIHKSKDKNQVTVTLSFRNITKETVMVAMELGYGTFPKATLSCHNGEVIDRPDITGMHVEIRKKMNKERCSIIGSGDDATVILSFRNKNKIESDTFSLAIEMLCLINENEKPIRFNVGIPNLKL